MNSEFILVSFYTKNTPYEHVMREYLGKSLQQYDIPSVIYAVESQGKWMKNVAMKPEYILLALHDYPGVNLVFIDADATLERYPTLFQEMPAEADLAVHYLDKNAWYQNTYTPQYELLTGTMWFRNSEKVKRLVQLWLRDAQMSGIVEQRCLQHILEKEQGAYNIYKLPLSYCYMASLPDGRDPLVKVEHPVITHYQLSRKYRRLI